MRGNESIIASPQRLSDLLQNGIGIRLARQRDLAVASSTIFVGVLAIPNHNGLELRFDAVPISTHDGSPKNGWSSPDIRPNRFIKLSHCNSWLMGPKT